MLYNVKHDTANESSKKVEVPYLIIKTVIKKHGELKMSATKKVENYTAAMTADIKADYAAGVSVAAIAEKVGKSVRSVVAKLSREGVYEKKEYTTKTGDKAESKAEIVSKIAAKLNVAPEVVGSLEAGTKQALKAVLVGLE